VRLGLLANVLPSTSWLDDENLLERLKGAADPLV
jgi:hypothetical protein